MRNRKPRQCNPGTGTITTLTAALLLTVFASSVSAAGLEILAPHRAVYDLTLDEASERSGITTMNGRIVYEVTSACEGLSVKYRLVSDIVTPTENYRTDQRTATFESADGKEFTFFTRSFVDDRPESSVKGSATRSADATDVSLVEPEKRELKLSPSIFLSTHLVDVIDAAKKGETQLIRDIFDGSDAADEVVASSTFIGTGRPAAKIMPGEDEKAAAALPAGETVWPVTVSYFDRKLKNSAESLPLYEASFLMYENGVSRDLVMRYPDYSLKGVLVGFEMLERPQCAK